MLPEATHGQTTATANIISLKIIIIRGWKMAQSLTVLTDPTEDLGSIPTPTW